MGIRTIFSEESPLFGADPRKPDLYTGFSYSLYDTGTEDISGKAETIFIRTEDESGKRG